MFLHHLPFSPFFPSILSVLSFLYEKCTIKLQCYWGICFLFLSIQITLESHLFSSFQMFKNKISEKDGFEQWFIWGFAAANFSQVWLCSVPWWKSWFKVIFHTCLYLTPQLFSSSYLSNPYLIRTWGAAVLQLSAIK